MCVCAGCECIYVPNQDFLISLQHDMIVGVFWPADSNTALMDKEFRHLRRSLLRSMAKKLTHPIYGLVHKDDDKFRGCEIVDWLSTTFDFRSRQRAVEFGRLLQASGIVYPLRRTKMEINGPRKNVRFSDKMRHWRFDFAAIDSQWPTGEYSTRWLLTDSPSLA